MTLFKTSKLSMAGFSFPAMPLAAFLQAMYFFLTPLYAVEMGLGTAAVGGIFFTAKMFDVVTDPLFGALSDRYKTPWGRRRPWLVVGMLILMLSIYMLFMPAGTVSASYFLGWLVFMYIGWTMTTVSHTAWALELSADYDQRTHITGWLQVSVMIGMMLVALTPAVLEQLGVQLIRPTLDYFPNGVAISWTPSVKFRQVQGQHTTFTAVEDTRTWMPASIIASIIWSPRFGITRMACRLWILRIPQDLSSSPTGGYRVNSRTRERRTESGGAMATDCLLPARTAVSSCRRKWKTVAAMPTVPGVPSASSFMTGVQLIATPFGK